MNLSGKVAVVTGGGTGLGRAISLHLAKAGASVVVNYSQSRTDAQQTVHDIRKLGIESTAIKADVTSSEQVKGLAYSVVERFGRVDVLVANAGTTVFREFSDLEGVTEADWDRIMDTNVKGIWLCAKHFAPYLKMHGEGRVVVVTSIAGMKPTGSSLPYSVSKAAAIHLTRGLAKALAPDILVNSIAPGLLDTRWTQGQAPTAVADYVEQSFLHRLPTLEDCAREAVGLCETNSITGQTVVIDSGMSPL